MMMLNLEWVWFGCVEFSACVWDGTYDVEVVEVDKDGCEH